jgi:hypothetical protein
LLDAPRRDEEQVVAAVDFEGRFQVADRNGWGAGSCWTTIARQRYRRAIQLSLKGRHLRLLRSRLILL